LALLACHLGDLSEGHGKIWIRFAYPPKVFVGGTIPAVPACERGALPTGKG
jgi:hypothetical protein